MLENIVELLRGVVANDELSVILLSILPMIELRGAIPIAIGMGLHPAKALILALLGTSIAIIPNMIFVKPFLMSLKKSRLFRQLVENFEFDINAKANEINKNSSKKRFRNLAKYIAITLFVAVPLPFTGAYTGSTLAVFVGLGNVKGFIAVVVGNVIAGSILTLLSVYFNEHLDLIVGILAVLVVFAFLSYAYSMFFEKKKRHRKTIKLHKSPKLK